MERTVGDYFAVDYGYKGQDSVLVHLLGPSMNDFGRSDIFLQVKPVRFRNLLKELEQRNFVFRNERPDLHLTAVV